MRIETSLSSSLKIEIFFHAFFNLFVKSLFINSDNTGDLLKSIVHLINYIVD